ncbi:MAG: thioredoxin domain-containing protein [Minisyncoccia bacterium]
MTTQKESPFVEKYLTPIAVLLGAIIIAVAFAFGSGERPATTGDGQPIAKVDIKKVQTGSSPVVGSPTAPIAIAVWFDYQCPFCKRFELEALEQVYQAYVVTGKIRIVYKDFQFLGPDSMDAAVFARGVWEAYPDQYYAWHQAVMTAQDEEHGGFGDLASVAEVSRGVAGVDADRVLALVEKNRATYEAAIEADREEGSSFGINGTPGAIIGTALISGAQPYSAVKAALDAALAK